MVRWLLQALSRRMADQGWDILLWSVLSVTRVECANLLYARDADSEG